MNIFELLLFALLVAILKIGTKASAHFLGVADWVLSIPAICLAVLFAGLAIRLNARGQLIFGGMLGIVIFGSRALQHFTGVTDWVFVIPIIAFVFPVVYSIGNRFLRQWKNSFSKRERNVD